MSVNPQDTTTIEIEIPAELLTEMSEEQLQRVAREALYVQLYGQGLITSGRAGALLGLSRSDFLDLLGRSGASYFDEDTDLEADLRNAGQART